MTREEAIFVLKRDNPNNIAIRTGFESLFDQRNEAFSMAIEALEQEPILDKIRAEIEALPIAFTSSFEMKQDCLDILDKYKGESEVEDGNDD